MSSRCGLVESCCWWPAAVSPGLAECCSSKSQIALVHRKCSVRSASKSVNNELELFRLSMVCLMCGMIVPRLSSFRLFHHRQSIPWTRETCPCGRLSTQFSRTTIRESLRTCSIGSALQHRQSQSSMEGLPPPAPREDRGAIPEIASVVCLLVLPLGWLSWHRAGDSVANLSRHSLITRASGRPTRPGTLAAARGIFCDF